MRHFFILVFVTGCLSIPRDSTFALPRVEEGSAHGSDQPAPDAADAPDAPDPRPVADAPAATDAPLSEGPRVCDAGHDHCLRPGTWFVLEGAEAVAVYRRDGRWHRWGGAVVTGGTAYRSAPATAAMLVSGRAVLVPSQPVTSEHAALTMKWKVAIVWEVAGGRFTSDRGEFPVGSARVTREPQAIDG
jgi:hypothetical protein